MGVFVILMIVLLNPKGEPTVGTAVMENAEACEAAASEFSNQFEAAHPYEYYAVACIKAPAPTKA